MVLLYLLIWVGLVLILKKKMFFLLPFPLVILLAVVLLQSDHQYIALNLAESFFGMMIITIIVRLQDEK